MKFQALALTSLLAAFTLSGCADIFDFGGNSYAMDDYSPYGAQEYYYPSNQQSAPKPRRHFERGEQVGLEVPFSSGRSKAKTTPAASNSQTGAPDHITETTATDSATINNTVNQSSGS